MRYQVGGSLGGDDPNYVVRQADEQLYAGLKAGNFCYVLNSRQMGKSSLLQRTRHRLEKEGYACVYLDMTRLGSESTTPVQWYKGIIVSLFYEFNLEERVNFKQWWEQQAELAPVQRLHQFVEQVLLKEVESDRIFIFIDEIDSLLSLNFPVNDFFAWIRHCYNQQAYNPDFNRLGFALFGVVSPSDLIADKRRTPFNIGQAIELYGFQLHEATPLLKGIKQIISQPTVVLQEIIRWTGGQPFLTQKLCQLVVRVALESSTEMITIPPGAEGFWVEQLIKSRIIQHWESQDEPEHLRTIRDRLLFHEHRAGRLLGLYQQILQAQSNQTSGVPTDDSREQTELLLSGLVEKHNGYLKIKNPIYESVFNAEWVIRQLDNLRPYSQTFNAWVASGYQDESRLLRGKALKDTQNWAQGKSLSNLDYQFLAACQECEQRQVQTALEAARALEIEARLAQEKQTAKFQRFLLIAVCIGLLVSTTLGIGAFILYRQANKSESQAKSSEIKALVSSSEGLLTSNRRLDALIEAIKAKHKLQKLRKPDTNIQHQVENVLQQAVYGADEYNRFSGHTAAVLAVDVSPDSSLIASASMDQTIKLWRGDGTEVATLKGHQGAVRAVHFSPDGQILASASEDGTIKLWRRDGTLLNTFKGHTASVWGVAFSPDGQFLASASGDETVKIWKRDGTLLNTFPSYSKGFWGVAFSPDGQIVAATNLDKTVKLWKRDTSGWQNAKLLQTLKGHSAWVMGVAFSPDGQMIASSSEDTTVKLWQRDSTGKYSQYKTLKGHSAGIQGVTFSPDGQTIASASQDKTIKIWHIDGTEQRTLKGHTASVWGVSWSKDSSFIASAGAENVVRLWQSQNPFQKSIVAHKAGIWSIAITDQSSTIATASHENTAKLWNRQGKLLKTLTGGGTVFEVSFSKDGKLIALASYDDTVKIRRRDGTNVASYKDAYGKITAAALSPDGQTIAIANVDKIVQIWKRSQPAPQILKGHTAQVWQVAFSPDGRLVASASGDGTVKLWTLEGKLLRTLVGHSATVWRVAFSQDSKMVASGSADNTVKLWTVEGKLLKTLTGHTAGIWGVAFSPDGKIVASGSMDTTIKLWKLDGTELTTLRGHTAAIRKIAISRDGTLLVSGGDDNTLIIWNLQRILHLDALTYGCTLVQDYLKTNAALEKSDRSICKEKGMGSAWGIGNGAWGMGEPLRSWALPLRVTLVPRYRCANATASLTGVCQTLVRLWRLPLGEDSLPLR
ncbi:AAA-like domain-containing protein [Nostoc sp. CENA67]|uniref:AAA-like domain-containing protein n=1 Tax=Amazonocrinis nigriterrae CENA67 TaxID=2794033 RepID=A0A8J7L9D1_9NOST|nr:AAA-like domain-containing protein [Amazonocrinis nigriterrae]MBH8565444.1 AAA-like domain-containing protein [Amazonocrinis nigriterrae CENA67]